MGVVGAPGPSRCSVSACVVHPPSNVMPAVPSSPAWLPTADVQELWSLFDFLMPGLLGSERQFNARYGRMLQVGALRGLGR